MKAKISALLFVVASGGCMAGVGYSGSAYVQPAPVYASVQVEGPDLVEVSPGIQVIADYDEPVFYTDNYYWRYSGNTWYRSSIHTGGWVVYNDVPYSVRHIERPTAYVRYRPNNWQPRARRQQQPAYRAPDRGPTVRDHRRQEPYRQDPGPTVRDHRQQPQPDPGPTVRDHRQQPQPRPDPGPTVRDHRTQPQPQPERDEPTSRDHRHH